MLRALAITLLAALTPLGVAAQQSDPPPEAVEVEPPMTLQRLAAILTVLDPDAVVEPTGATLTIASVPVTVIVDPRADRMRILVPISSADGLGEAELMRLLQANFDSALDARYAIANDRLWSTFIHPFSPLETAQLISGLAQTVTLAQTYGESYSSGAIMFGGGDSGGLLADLLERGEEL